MNQAVLPGLDEPRPVIPRQDPDEFDWLSDEAVIVEQQRSIAVNRNPRDHAVIRSEGAGFDDEDKAIILSTADALKALIVALQRELKAGLR